MTKTKRQLRAEAVERLRGIKLDPEGSSHERLSAICGAIRRPAYAWTRGACENVVRTLIDLLTDDDAVDDCGQIADMSQKGGDCVRDGGEMSEVASEVRERSLKSESASESDTREELEADELDELAWQLRRENNELCLGVIADYKRKVDALQSMLDHYERDYVAPLKRAGFTEHAQGVSGALEALTAKADELTAENAELERIVDRLAAERDRWRRAAGRNGEKLGKLRDRERELVKALEAMRTKQAMPKGVEWPRFEDGACVSVGDEFVGCDGEPHELACVKFLDDGYLMMEAKWDSSDGFNGYTSLGCGFWSYGETFERPPVLASDGQPIEVGQVLYGESDGKKWTVTGISHGKKYPVLAECRDAFPIEVEERALNPEWLTHEAPDSWEHVIGEIESITRAHENDECMTVSGSWLYGLVGRIEKLAKEGGASCR